MDQLPTSPTVDKSAAPTKPGISRAMPVAIVATFLPIAGSVVTAAFAVQIAHWLRAQGHWGIVYFTLAYVLAGALMLATTYTSSALAGWTFGFCWGMVAILIGVSGGAMLAYWVARRLAAARVRETYGSHPKWEIVRRALVSESRRRALWIVFLLRLSPVLPFGTTNVLLATSGMTPGLYLLGTVLGLVPRFGVVALAAASVEKYEMVGEGGWGMLIGSGIVTVAMIGVMIFLGRRALTRATKADHG